MPQFAPGEVKTARAPITVKPSGLSCSAELYLVSNGAKVATSGIKLFTSTGVRQDISFPITMPGAEGSYPVYLDIFANGLLIGAYKAVEDVVIKIPTLLSYVSRYGSIEILQIDGKGFSEVGTGYAVLSEPIVKSDLKTAVSITWRNISLRRYDPDGYNKIQFRLRYAVAGRPYDDEPQFITKVRTPPIDSINTTRPGRWYGGYWSPRIYDGLFSWGLVYWDQVFGVLSGHFTIKNMVRCTGSGHYEWPKE